MSEQLAYETCGNADGPAALLVHGFFSSNLQWVRSRERLGRQLQLVLVETWRHGRSPAPEDADAYTVGRYVEEIDQIRRAVGIERMYLVGHSFGAGVLTQYALARPERVAGIVSTNSLAAFGSISPEAVQAYLKAIDENPADLPMHPANGRKPRGRLRQRFVDAANSVDLHAARQAVAHYSTISCVDRLADFMPPMLLINGIREVRFQPQVEFIRASYGHIQVTDVDAGHSPNLERPNVFDALVCEFISRN